VDDICDRLEVVEAQKSFVADDKYKRGGH